MSLTRPNTHRRDKPPGVRRSARSGPLTEAEAQTYVHGICFKTGPPSRIGVELEWFVHDAGDPALPVEPSRLAEALVSVITPPSRRPEDRQAPVAATDDHPPAPGPVRPGGTAGPPEGTTTVVPGAFGPPATAPPAGATPSATTDPPSATAAPPSATAPPPVPTAPPTVGDRLPAGALLTREPGGQVELSSLPAESLSECVAAVRRDLEALRDALGAHGLLLAGYGHDLWRPPRRTLDLPRYAAMEEFFDRQGPAGRSMMCGTASVQVCLDAGTESPGPSGFTRRWRLAHLLGPVLVAAFANSPLLRGRPSGWRSTRQAVWTRLDPSRTLAPPGADPRAAWAAYALDAELLCVRRDDGRPWTAPPGTTFRQWIHGQANGAGEPPPTRDDFAYHLTTLFPPVRPQGHLELRMIDAQAGPDGWIVPLAVVTALFEDADAALLAETVTERLAVPGPAAPRNPLWLRAARRGLADPALRRAAQACFAAAQAALARLDAPPEVRSAVAEFAERYVARGRCPADDLLDAVSGGGNAARLRSRPGRSRSWKETPPC